LCERADDDIGDALALDVVRAERDGVRRQLTRRSMKARGGQRGQPRDLAHRDQLRDGKEFDALALILTDECVGNYGIRSAEVDPDDVAHTLGHDFDRV